MKNPWLGRPIVDIAFILSPPFICLLAIALFPGVFQNSTYMPVSWWITLILLVDVAHVYSTLYRTYFNPVLFQEFKRPLIYIPLLAFASGALIYWLSDLWFWRILAYLAVFHFVRQQYGFMKLYGRFENTPVWQKLIDKFTIYYATIFPLIYWHLDGKRNFNWFVDNDFFYFSSTVLLKGFAIIYILMLVVYLGKVAYVAMVDKELNIPKIAVIAGTILSWYFGIVYFNGDLTFTLLNVVSHGIPYMALIWIFAQKESRQQSGRLMKLVFGQFGIILFLGLIFFLAYVEEGLWDRTVWGEHKEVFGVFHRVTFELVSLPFAIIIPFLAIPQITHYVIDGFIWRKKKY